MYIRDYIPVGYVGENVAHYKDLCCIGAGGKEAESAKADSPNLATGDTMQVLFTARNTQGKIVCATYYEIKDFSLIDALKERFMEEVLLYWFPGQGDATITVGESAVAVMAEAVSTVKLITAEALDDASNNFMLPFNSDDIKLSKLYKQLRKMGRKVVPFYGVVDGEEEVIAIKSVD